MKNTITRTATKTLAHNNIAAGKEWIITEIVNMIEERRKYKINIIKRKSSYSIDGKDRYIVLRNLIIKKSREAKEKYLADIVSEIDIFIKAGSIDEECKMVKKFFGHHKLRAVGIEKNVIQTK